MEVDEEKLVCWNRKAVGQKSSACPKKLATHAKKRKLQELEKTCAEQATQLKSLQSLHHFPPPIGIPQQSPGSWIAGSQTSLTSTVPPVGGLLRPIGRLERDARFIASFVLHRDTGNAVLESEDEEGDGQTDEPNPIAHLNRGSQTDKPVTVDGAIRCSEEQDIVVSIAELFRNYIEEEEPGEEGSAKDGDDSHFESAWSKGQDAKAY